MDSPLQLLSISGAVIPGDEGVDAAADTDENAGKQRYGGGGGADGAMDSEPANRPMTAISAILNRT